MCVPQDIKCAPTAYSLLESIEPFCSGKLTKLRACSHGGGGPQVGEVPHLPGVRKNRPSHATPGRWGEV